MERISAIKDKKGAAVLSNDPKVVLHIIPISAFTTVIETNPCQFREMYEQTTTSQWFCPFGKEDINNQNEINLEGFLIYNQEGYVQLYREGIIEAVSILPADKENKTIQNSFYEKALLKQNYLNILKKAGFIPPFCIFISMLCISDYKLQYPAGTGYAAYYTSRKYNRSEILLKEIVMDSFNDTLDNLFRPFYDRFCNAWGLQNCMNFNSDGTYKFS